MANSSENREMEWRAVKPVNDFRNSLVQLQLLPQGDLRSKSQMMMIMMITIMIIIPNGLTTNS
jgi:hypothetical protein